MANLVSAHERIGDDTKGSLRFPIKNIIKSAQFYNCWKTKSLLSLSLVSSTTWGVELEVGGSGKNYLFLAFHKSADNMFLSPSTPRKYHIVGVQFKLFLFALLFSTAWSFSVVWRLILPKFHLFLLALLTWALEFVVCEILEGKTEKLSRTFPIFHEYTPLVCDDSKSIFLLFRSIELHSIKSRRAWAACSFKWPETRRWWKIVIFPAD